MEIKKIIKTTICEYFNESITQKIANKYSKNDVIYHCSDNFRNEFKLEYVKGGNRGIHGWGIYFASTPFKASDYGDYMTIVDKSNLNLLPLDTIINEKFIQNIKLELDYNDFGNIRNEINVNNEYLNLKDYNINNISDLKSLEFKLEDKLMYVRNNNEYNEINSVIINIKKLLSLEKSNNINDEMLYYLNNIKDKTINDLLIYFYNYKTPKHEKEFSLFLSKCNYDGFNYDDYEYVIFKTDNLKILEHIKI